MSLVDRVQDFRLARKKFLDVYMPKGEEICLKGVLVRPFHEIAATYEASFFQRSYTLRPRREKENVVYIG